MFLNVTGAQENHTHPGLLFSLGFFLPVPAEVFLFVLFRSDAMSGG